MRPLITFAVEPWNQFKIEAVPLWQLHYDEVGQDKQNMPLEVDIDKVDRFDALGMMHIVTARKAGELIGYHVSILDTLLHYKSVLAANGDIYWIKPELRKSGLGFDLFKEAERTLKARGVKVLYNITKLYADHDKLFDALGYKPIERKYSKWVGD